MFLFLFPCFRSNTQQVFQRCQPNGLHATYHFCGLLSSEDYYMCYIHIILRTHFKGSFSNLSISDYAMLFKLFLQNAGVIAVAASVIPLILIPVVPLLIIFLYLRSFYLRTSRDVKRLESTSALIFITILS